MTRYHVRAVVGQLAGALYPPDVGGRSPSFGELALEGLVAGMSVEAAPDRGLLLPFVEHVLLVPVLKPGQVVVLNSLSVHKMPAVRPLIEGARCTLHFLPQYSPDLNPIEQARSKCKALLRAAARVKGALDDALTAVLDHLTAADALARFTHRDYATGLN